MSDLVTARLVLRPITEADVAAVLDGQRDPGWAEDFPADGDRVIARVLARTGLPADEASLRFGHRLVVEQESGLVVGGAGFFGPPQGGVCADDAFFRLLDRTWVPVGASTRHVSWRHADSGMTAYHRRGPA